MKEEYGGNPSTGQTTNSRRCYSCNMAFLKITRRIGTSVVLALFGAFAYFSRARPIYRIFFLYIILGSNSLLIETVLGLLYTINWLTVILK